VKSKPLLFSIEILNNLNFGGKCGLEQLSDDGHANINRHLIVGRHNSNEHADVFRPVLLYWLAGMCQPYLCWYCMTTVATEVGYERLSVGTKTYHPCLQ
jgi:hypothetical protein